MGQRIVRRGNRPGHASEEDAPTAWHAVTLRGEATPNPKRWDEPVVLNALASR